MDNSLQYKAMRKLLMSLVKPKYDKIIDDIKVVALSQISDTPTVKVYLVPNFQQHVSVENPTNEDLVDLLNNIDWKISEALKHMGSPRYWVEFIQTQP
jgi:hypothetical protein